MIQRARGRALDRLAGILGLRREPARLWGFALPWLQRDSTLRARALAHLRRFTQRAGSCATCDRNGWPGGCPECGGFQRGPRK